ncbi:MAG TPA: GH1 family beta-glucosidase [Thermoanaerobaculia bacterium]|nr:GH1 family beta-glucosidase [Thermoanaerobaculia bacterium]
MGAPFPDDFLWGAATSAYQIEGSPLADGAGESNWHRFAHTPGLIANGDTGDVACDHYRRWRDDVALMRELGLGAYRFSIAWSRVLPEGTGAVNQRGLDFYRRLVAALREAGIEPMATLYHWDHPAALDERGGWLNPDSPRWFADYARVCFDTLDGEVRLWATLNEPWVVCDGGHLHGTLAPGHRSRWEAPRVAHHLLLAHAEAVLAYRAGGRHRIGLVVNVEPKHPASDSPEDVAAAARDDAYMNRHFLDPALVGRYPEELPAIYGEGWREPPAADLERIRQPLDFLGLNYYTRAVVRHDPACWPTGAGKVRQPGSTYTTLDWEVYPQGLEETIDWLRQRYGPVPLYVTENGAAFADPPASPGGRIEDAPRVAYLREHLLAVRRSLAAGADVRGYFAWSLLDNFEWSKGYEPRFGIVHVNRATQRRTPKASAEFYREVIRTRVRALDKPAMSS